MSGHTPGPWRAGYASDTEQKYRMLVRAEEVEGQPYVAICPNWDGGGRHEANARLIAAAPEFRRAFALVVIRCHDYGGHVEPWLVRWAEAVRDEIPAGDMDACHEVARKAIAKAEGRS